MESPEGLAGDIVESVELGQEFIDKLDRELAELDGVIDRAVRDNEVVKRLQTIPGVGRVIATTLYATVGDIRRFRSARELCSYAGLVPSVRQSGDVERMGRITKQGNGALRSVLVQGAHRVSFLQSKQAEALRERFHRMYEHRGRRKIAIVATARHMLRIAYYVWRDEVPYRPPKSKEADEAR